MADVWISRSTMQYFQKEKRELADDSTIFTEYTYLQPGKLSLNGWLNP